jgi:hypothetical protein
MASVLALGLDPLAVDTPATAGLPPELVRAYIDEQIGRVRSLGHEVISCLVDAGETAEDVLAACLNSRRFDCVLIGAGLRDPVRLLLFERLLNRVHLGAAQARICFNQTPADSVEAVQRCLSSQSG